jgi:hypothetical protein
MQSGNEYKKGGSGQKENYKIKHCKIILSISSTKPSVKMKLPYCFLEIHTHH